jgi:hypothetical protein
MRRSIKRAAISAVFATGIMAASATPALADTKGAPPNGVLSCGALRDIPNQWTVVANAGWCPGWGYSYILTSPSTVHYATWSWAGTGGVLGNTDFSDPIEVWIPSVGAGAVAEYDYQTCGSSTWHRIGTLNQEADSGWYSPGSVPLSTTVPVCAIREHNVGSGTWDMAEDALGFLH